MLQTFVVAASRLALLLFAAAALAESAGAKPPITAFAEAPGIRSMTLSPGGEQIAWIQAIEGVDYVLVRKLGETGSRSVAKIEDGEVNQVEFLTDRYLLMIASDIRFYYGSPGKLRFGAASIHDLEKNRTYRMDACCNILSIAPEKDRVYVGGRYAVLGVSLSTGNTMDDLGGRWYENDWLVTPEAKVIASAEFNQKESDFAINRLDGTYRRPILKQETKIPDVSLVGFTPLGAIVVRDSRNGADPTLRALDLADGSVGEPLFESEGGDASAALVDYRGVVHGVVVSGAYPSYRFFDETLTRDMRRMAATFPGRAVWLQDWSEDWNRLLIQVVGGTEAGRLVLFDRKAVKVTPVMLTRPELAPSDIGEVIAITYKARDGLTIQAIVTWPAGVSSEARKALPMVVMPHGGPEVHDAVTYNTWAQFLANEGYLVLQPNFRGSSGYGVQFRNAGFRQFGRAMQDDISDGVEALVKTGWADPRRVCIVGASYGGYAALAGGALTPDLYKCVVAIAPVTDLPGLLKDIANRTGSYSLSTAYWRRYLGDSEADRAELDAYSPVNLAGKIQAPVLLIHGENDTTSPIKQSRDMVKALKAAGKTPRFVELPSEQHNLLQVESRAKVFDTIAGFLAQYLARE